MKFTDVVTETGIIQLNCLKNEWELFISLSVGKFRPRESK